MTTHPWTWVFLLVAVLCPAAAYDRHRALRPVNGVHPDVARSADEPITSIAVQGDFVFVTNRHGMFRASRTQKQWSPVKLPVTAPMVGELLDPRVSGSRLLYQVSPDRRGAPGFGTGIYTSDDAGQTWRRILPDEPMSSVLVTTGGNIFAISTRFDPATGKPSTSTFKESTDGGRTWREPWAGTSLKGINLGMLQDPDDPGSVAVANGYPGPLQCFRHFDSRGGWVVLKPEEFGPSSCDNPFRGAGPGCALGERGQRLTASLTNYFPQRLGLETTRHVVGVSTGADEYTFALDGPKPIDVTLTFDGPNGEFAIYDDPDTTAVFELGAVCPGWRRIRVMEGNVYLLAPQDDPSAKTYEKWREKRPQAREFIISKERPYHRTLDLSRMMPFMDAGTYRVQLAMRPLEWSPNSVAVSDRGRMLLLYGPIITVHITGSATRLAR